MALIGTVYEHGVRWNGPPWSGLTSGHRVVDKKSELKKQNIFIKKIISKRYSFWTHLHYCDEDYEEWRRKASVAIGIVLAIPLLGQDLHGHGMDHFPEEWRFVEHQLKIVLGADFSIPMVYGAFEAPRPLAAHLEKEWSIIMRLYFILILIE